MLVGFLLKGIIAPSIYEVAAASTNTSANLDIYTGYQLLKHIGSCESWGDPNKEPREFLSDGTVLRGYPNPDDIGAFQINLPTWGASATKLGYDIYTFQGNFDMAKWIFDNYGAQQWKYSEGCWGQYK